MAPYIGTGTSRIDGVAKVTGAAKYAAEFNAPGLLHGSIATSTIAKGRITRIDASAAKRVKGVLDVLICARYQRLDALPPLLESVDFRAINERLKAAYLQRSLKPVREREVLARVRDKDFGFRFFIAFRDSNMGCHKQRSLRRPHPKALCCRYHCGICKAWQMTKCKHCAAVGVSPRTGPGQMLPVPIRAAVALLPDQLSAEMHGGR
jgi:Aldehyde oxidase and xanthine dehydrogenase, a/b hammerhead domain